MLQPLANHLVGAQQVGRGDTLAIGRIGDNDTLCRRLGEVLEVLFVDGNVVGQPCGTDIEACRVDCLDVDVIAVDVVVELSFL